MPEYEVKYQIRVPTSRNSQSGAVKYISDGYTGKKVTVTASSAEEARKLATKSPEVAKARDFSASRLDYDMPKPRVKILDVSPRGGGSLPEDPLRSGAARKPGGGLPKRMAKGGLVNKGKKGKK